MQTTEYSQYFSDLSSLGRVVFPDRDTLIEFMSIMISKDYEDFLRARFRRATTIADKEALKQRMSSEPTLVSCYVKSFLKQQVPMPGGLWYKFKKMVMAHPPKRKEIVIDTDVNTELYDFVLEKLHQGDSAMGVFSSFEQFVIAGDKEVFRFSI